MSGTEIQAGDVVELKSGSPSLTVQRVYQDNRTGSWDAVCAWHVPARDNYPPEIREQIFSIAALTKRT